MKKNIFKFLTLILSLIFTVGCEMTLSFNDYNEARNKTATTTTKTTNSSGDTTSNGGNSTTNPSISNTTRGPESSTTTKSSSTNMTVNRFTVVLHMPSGETNEITVQRWNNESMPEEFRQGVTVVLNGDQYTIVGYYTDPDFNNPIDLETAKIENDIDLYAKFEKIEPLPDKVTITYVSNGGVETEALVVDRGTKIASRNLPSITKLATDTKKFIFGGWYYDVNFVLKVNVDDEINQDTKIYAKWREVVREGLYEYTESEDLSEWYITGFIGKEEDTPENLVFPTTFNSKPVTKIQYGTSINKNNKIKTIEVPEGFTEFSARLTKLSQLRVLTLSSTLTSIDIDDNLRECYRLVEVYNISSIDLLGENTTYNYVHVIHTSMSEPSIIRQVGNLELAISSKGTYIIGTSEPIPANGELVMPSYIMVDGERVYGYHIGAFLYFQNSDIKKVTISKSIASVGQYSFSEVENLETVEINSVCDVLYGAFYSDRKLKTTFLGTSNIHFETLAFQDWYMEKVFAPSFFAWTTYKFDNYDASPMGYGYGVYLYLEDTTGDESYTFDGITKTYKKYTDLVIPEGTKEIGDYQFYGFKNLTDFSIPNSLEKIGRYAFGLNGVLGENSQFLTRTKVGYNNYTYSIKNGVIDGDYMYIGNSSNPYLLFEGINPFASNPDRDNITIKSGCKFIDANTLQRYPDSSSGDSSSTIPTMHLTVNIPSSVIQLMAGCFRTDHCWVNVYIDKNCQMKEIDAIAFEVDAYSYISIIIPESVTKIIEYYTVNNWRIVYFYGTKEQWDLIEHIETGYSYFTNSIYFYSATRPTWPEDWDGWYGFWYWGSYNGYPVIQQWSRE